MTFHTRDENTTDQNNKITTQSVGIRMSFEHKHIELLVKTTIAFTGTTK